MATASQVPSLYDVVLNGQGYTFLRTLDGSYLTAMRHRAEYTSTPTFVERQNVSNAYGDNAQDFFLTARQRDWSLGEQQKFYRSGQDGHYWMGLNVDVSTPGQVRLQPSSTTPTALAEAVGAGVRDHASVTRVLTAGATKLYQIDGAGVSFDLGAHGLGAIPAPFGVTTDAKAAYLSTTTAGTVGVRRYTSSATTTFSATASDALAFLNNTLFGLQGLNVGGVALVQYDSSGTATTLFTWKGADGSTQAHVPFPAKIEAFGGKLLILLSFGQETGAELWIYDGSGASRLEVFPSNYWAWDLEVLYGVAYISGSFLKNSGSSDTYGRPAIHFFDGSNVGLLWKANDWMTSALSLTTGPHPALGMFQGNLIFTDDTTGNLMAYDPSRGGVSTISSYAVSGDTVRILPSGTTFIQTRNSTSYNFFPAPTYPTSGYVVSSLIDFESSLPKFFRGVRVEFDVASDGDGGSVDIAYQVDSLTGSWTTLKTGATSGTEYTLTNISGHSVAIKVTINTGTSTSGPTLKSLNVRAAPVLQSYKLRQYNLDLSSDDNHVTLLQDGSSFQPLSGYEQALNLQTAISSSIPISVTDRFGTFTAVCEPAQCSIVEIHSEGSGPGKSGQYEAVIQVREV